MAVNLSNISDVALTFSLSEAIPILQILAIYILGITIYSIFIFKFYRFISKKDIFSLNLQQYNSSSSPNLRKFVSVLLYICEYLIIFPMLVALWFSVLFVLLVFLSKDQLLGSILLTSMAIIAIVRITSYYNEDLSKDLAKMLPFTLLGIFLVDSTYFNISESIKLLKSVPEFWRISIYYFFFVIVLEFLCRITYAVYSLITDKSVESD